VCARADRLESRVRGQARDGSLLLLLLLLLGGAAAAVAASGGRHGF